MNIFYKKNLLTSLFLSMALGLSGCGQNALDAECGNGTLEAGEQCDDGDTVSGDGCSANCEEEDEDECGDGDLGDNEECDDGNTLNGDGCSSDCEEESPSEAQLIDEYITSLGVLETQPPSQEVGPAGPVQNIGPYECRTSTVTEVKVFDRYTSQGAIVNQIYPGMLMRGDSLQDGSFEEVPLPKKPLTLSINVGNDNASIVMPNPSRSGFINAQNDLFIQAVGPDDAFAPKFGDVFNSDTVNEDQLSLELGFDVNAGIATNVDVAGQFNFQNNTKRNRRLIRIVSELYTVTADKPAKASDFLANSVTAQDVAGLFGAGNPAVYVDSITYGRVVYIAIESNFTSTEIDAALAVAVDSAQADVQLDFGLTVKQVLDELTIQGIVVGGIIDATGSDLVDLNNLKNPEALQRIHNREAKTTFNQRGEPVSFTVAYLSNGSSATTSVAGEYPVENCNRAPADFLVDVNRFVVTDARDGLGNSAEIHGTISVSFGGDRVDLFRRNAGSEVDFDLGIMPASTFLSGQLDNVNTTPGNFVTVEINLVEVDSGADDVFNDTFDIPVESLFTGEHKITFSGANITADLFIGFTPLVSPLP